MSLKDVWKNKVDEVDDVLAKDINDIAHQAIENENSIQNLNTKTQENKENIEDLSLKTQKNEASIIQLNTDLIINKEEIAEHESKIENLETLRIIPKVGGSLIPLSDSAEASLQGMRIFGKTKQTTTTGKNKLPYPYVNTTLTNDGVTFTDNGDGSITINGTAQSAVSFAFTRADILEDGKTYYLPSNIQDCHVYCAYKDASGATKYGQHKIEWSSEYTMVQIYVQTIQGKTYSNVKAYPIIVEGDSYDGNWEPFTGGMPSPSFSYKQDMKNDGDKGSIELFVKGKNLYSGYVELSNLTETDGVFTQLKADTSTSSTIKLQKIDFEDIVTNIVAYKSINTGLSSMTFTKDETYKSIRFGVNGTIQDTLMSIDVQHLPNGTYRFVYNFTNITQGSFSWKDVAIYPASITDNTYEPYKQPQSLTIPTPNGLSGIPVTFGGNYTDENGQQYVSDYKDYERMVYVQSIKKRIFTGDDNEAWKTWGVNSTVTGNTGFYIYVTDGKIKNFWGNSIFSNAFFPKTSVHGGQALGCSYHADSSSAYIAVGVSNGMLEDVSSKDAAVASFKKLLSANPVTFLYMLKTPIETPLSEEEIEAYKALHTNYPNTTIYNDEGAYTEVKYVADTKNYVDNKIANEVAKLTAAIITE